MNLPYTCAMKFSRYAIFFTPPPGPFADFGAAWLGWDSETGQVPQPPEIADLPAPLHDITQSPRKYGFHGTIKPPFGLASGAKPEDLQDALEGFCRTRAPVQTVGLELAQLGRFLALVPVGKTRALNDLAADTVVALDPFRAPMGADDLARRRSAHLSPKQDALLVKWGYPYVMEEFRFHLTLTGKLPKAQATATRQILIPHLAPLLPYPFVINHLSLMGEASDSGRFHLIARIPLSGKP